MWKVSTSLTLSNQGPLPKDSNLREEVINKSTGTQTVRQGINRDNAKNLQMLIVGPLRNWAVCMRYACAFTHNSQAELASERLWDLAGVWGEHSSCWYFWGSTSVEYLWDCLQQHLAGPAGEQRTMVWVRGSRQEGGWAERTHQCLGDPQKCVYFHYWMPILTTRRGGREPGCNITPESTVGGCCWRQYLVFWQPEQTWGCLALWATRLALLLVEPLNRKAAAVSIICEWDLWVLGHLRLGSSNQEKLSGSGAAGWNGWS